MVEYRVILQDGSRLNPHFSLKVAICCHNLGQTGFVYERKIDLIELQLNFENDYKQFRYLEEKYNDDTATTAADGKVYTPGQPLVNTEGFLGAKAISPSKTNILIGYLLVALSIFFSIFYAIEILKIIKIKDFISFDTLCNAVAVIAISVIYFGMAYCILKVLRHHD